MLSVKEIEVFIFYIGLLSYGSTEEWMYCDLVVLEYENTVGVVRYNLKWN